MKNTQPNFRSKDSIVFYSEPDEYVGFDKTQNIIFDFDISGWKLLIVTDSLKFNESCSSFVRGFNELPVSDRADMVSKLLWDLKTADESVEIKIKTTRFRDKFIVKSITTPLELEEALNYAQGRYNTNWGITFSNANGPTKFTSITGAEKIEIYFKPNMLEYVKSVLTKWAIPGEYANYK